MANQNQSKTGFILPILLLIAVFMLLAMLRLGVWQLDRADQKQELLDQVQDRSQSATTDVAQLVSRVAPAQWYQDLRFQPVYARGRYLAEHSILIDNQVMNQRVGYQLVTPFEVAGADQVMLVSRGWLPAGLSRQELPQFDTPEGEVSIVGRLNKPHAQPPLWREGYPVSQGRVWQYLPIAEYASQIQASVLPLVVELAPESMGTAGLKVRWQSIDDEWVAKHKGYAFQWFSMAAAFLIACLILVFRKFVKTSPD